MLPLPVATQDRVKTPASSTCPKERQRLSVLYFWRWHHFINTQLLDCMEIVSGTAWFAQPAALLSATSTQGNGLGVEDTAVPLGNNVTTVRNSPQKSRRDEI
jgi:hypothetical protein